MATNVLLPQWGMNMEDGTLTRWLVNEGDEIAEGQPLVEVETAKINSELESPASGVVSHIMAAEGSLVKVGELVAVIGEPGENPPRPEPKAAPSPIGARRRQRQRDVRPTGAAASQVTPVARRLARDNGIDLDGISGTGPRGRITEQDVRAAIDARQSRPQVQVVPRARMLARQEDIDLTDVAGSGPNGRITVVDVERAIAERDAVAARADAVGEVVPLTGLRKIIADRMTMSVSTMAQVTLTTEADVTELLNLRESLVSEWRPHRIRPLDLDFIIAAVAWALKAHPRLNAHLVDGNVLLLKEVNIGLAVAVPDGLVVPVLRGADSLDLLGIARQIRTLADKTRKNALGVDDMTGAGFTVTALSNYDIDVFTPIIDPPQVAILGLGRAIEKPVVVDGEIVVRVDDALERHLRPSCLGRGAGRRVHAHS
ncbi:Dihydrolipoyllysine-residue acetyltransferase component of acetoin cleaving system [Geodia barretti]|uniref:Dihydrolipoamide acetyltransferase component of pyruvate dehydrogenase complex n=1 Tax=Geodia barretti TaxID=519541 RepID=A0AA35SIS4_GEOBA|nr:Dihydrolipoyllysine-residue acetyltransferase component of acetoin cleaving system [Geodia barretti]